MHSNQVLIEAHLHTLCCHQEIQTKEQYVKRRISKEMNNPLLVYYSNKLSLRRMQGWRDR